MAYDDMPVLPYRLRAENLPDLQGNIEDRRGEAPYEPSFLDKAGQVVRNIYENATSMPDRSVAAPGSMEAQAGFNDVPGYARGGIVMSGYARNYQDGGEVDDDQDVGPPAPLSSSDQISTGYAAGPPMPLDDSNAPSLPAETDIGNPAMAAATSPANQGQEPPEQPEPQEPKVPKQLKPKMGKKGRGRKMRMRRPRRRGYQEGGEVGNAYNEWDVIPLREPENITAEGLQLEERQMEKDNRGDINDPGFSPYQDANLRRTNEYEQAQQELSAREALDHNRNQFGLNDVGTGYDQQGPGDIAGYYSGANAPPSEELDARLQGIKAQNPGISDSMAHMLAVGDPNIDLADRASNLSGLRNRFNAFNALAQGADAHGDTDAAMQFAQRAHEHVPDGTDKTFTRTPDGNIDITLGDTRTGGDQRSYRLSPSQFSDYLVGHATGFDHILDNGAEKNIQTLLAQGPITPAEFGAPVQEARLRGDYPQQSSSAPRVARPTTGVGRTMTDADVQRVDRSGEPKFLYGDPARPNPNYSAPKPPPKDTATGYLPPGWSGTPFLKLGEPQRGGPGSQYNVPRSPAYAMNEGPELTDKEIKAAGAIGRPLHGDAALLRLLPEGYFSDPRGRAAYERILNSQYYAGATPGEPRMQVPYTDTEFGRRDLARDLLSIYNPGERPAGQAPALSAPEATGYTRVPTTLTAPTQWPAGPPSPAPRKWFEDQYAAEQRYKAAHPGIPEALTPQLAGIQPPPVPPTRTTTTTPWPAGAEAAGNAAVPTAPIPQQYYSPSQPTWAPGRGGGPVVTRGATTFTPEQEAFRGQPQAQQLANQKELAKYKIDLMAQQQALRGGRGGRGGSDSAVLGHTLTALHQYQQRLDKIEDPKAREAARDPRFERIVQSVFDEQLRARGIDPASLSQARTGGGGGNAPVNVSSLEEAKRLPSGTRFIIPDGSNRIGTVP